MSNTTQNKPHLEIGDTESGDKGRAFVFPLYGAADEGSLVAEIRKSGLKQFLKKTMYCTLEFVHLVM